MQQRLKLMTRSGHWDIYCLYILMIFVRAIYILLYWNFQPTTTFATRQWLCFSLNKLPERELRECGISGCLHSVVSYFPAMCSSFPNSHFPIPYSSQSLVCVPFFFLLNIYSSRTLVSTHILHFSAHPALRTVFPPPYACFWVLRI